MPGDAEVLQRIGHPGGNARSGHRTQSSDTLRHSGSDEISLIPNDPRLTFSFACFCAVARRQTRRIDVRYG
jgi:hypothetical protein